MGTPETRNAWNYRVVRRTQGGGTFYDIHAAHYGDDKEKPRSITKAPVTARGGTVEELADVLDMMRKALKRPVLEYDDF